MLPRVAVLVVALAGCGGSDVSRTLGARCDVLSECNDRCLTGDDFPGGFCSVSCDVTGDCPADAECVDLEGGVCLFSCLEPANCEFLGLGWTCAPAAGAEGGEVTVCIGN